METLSAWLAICEGKPPVPGGISLQMANNAGFGGFFDFNLNKMLNKQ